MALRESAYKSQHVQMLRERAKWFEKAATPMYCLWWVPAGHLPTLAEARERLEHYQEHGGDTASSQNTETGNTGLWGRLATCGGLVIRLVGPSQRSGDAG
jgi:hypothetical protein